MKMSERSWGTVKMQYCGRCGEMIQGPGFPREIRVGSSSWASTTTDRPGIRLTNSVRYGRRTVCAVCASQLDKWKLLKWLALGSGGVVFAAIVLLSNPGPQYSNQTSSRPSMPSQYSPIASQQPVSPATQSRMTAPQEQQGRTSLEDSLDRLRQAQASNPVAVQPQPTPLNTPTPTGSEAGVRQQQVWPHITMTGTRWRLQPRQGEYSLLIELGSGQTATVRVAPEFQSLSLDAMNLRVDHARDVIASQYPLQSGSYIYTRDGVIYPDR